MVFQLFKPVVSSLFFALSFISHAKTKQNAALLHFKDKMGKPLPLYYIPLPMVVIVDCVFYTHTHM